MTNVIQTNMSDLVSKWEQTKENWLKEVLAEIEDFRTLWSSCRGFSVNTSQIEELCNWVKDFISARLVEISEEGKEAIGSLLKTACARSKDVYVTLVNESCMISSSYSQRNIEKVLNVTMEEYFQILNQIQLIIFVNSSTYVANMSLSPPLDSYQNYHICMKPTETMANFEFMIKNATVQKMYIELDNQHFSVKIFNSNFSEAGLAIRSTLNSIGKWPVIVNNCTFQDNSIQKSIIVINTMNVTVLSTVFKNLQSPPKFSAFFCNTSLLEINDSLFHNNSALPLLEFNECNVTVAFTNISRNRIGHGYLGLGLVTAARSRINIFSSNIEDNDGANYDVGFAPKENILNLESTNVVVNNCRFSGNKASYDKHVIFLDVNSDGRILDSSFWNNEGELLSSCVRVEGSATIRNTTFIGNGNFQMNDAQYGVFGCSHGVMFIQNVTLLNNTATLMWMRYTCKAYISSSYFKGNTFKRYTIPTFEVKAFLNINDCVFKQNEVMTIINMGGNSDTIIANTVFENNTFDKTRPYESSCVSVTTGKISIKNTVFVGNRVSPLCDAGIVTCYGVMSMENVTMLNNVGKTIQASYCIMNVSYSTFVNNSATECYEGAMVTNSNVIISDSDFHDNSAFYGGCVSVSNSNVTLLDSAFHNNNASRGGCVWVSNQERSIINVTRSKFFSNFASQEGGVFFVGGVSSLVGAEVLFSNCTMIENTAKKSGGALFLERCQTVLNFVTVADNQASVDGGGIAAEIYSSLQLYNVDARGNSAGNEGGFLTIDQKSNFIGKNLRLENNFAQKTGNDIVLNDYSVGTMGFIYFSDFSKKRTCSFAAYGHSNLTLKNIYSNNQAKVPKSNVCVSGRSYISKFTVGKLSFLLKKFHLVFDRYHHINDFIFERTI